MKTSGHYRNMVHNPCCILCFRRNIQFCFKEIEPHSFQYEADKYRYCKMYQKTHGINPRDSVMIAFSQFHVQKTLGGFCHCGINKRQKCDKAANNIVYSKIVLSQHFQYNPGSI
ncbi:hypothetical protein M125_5578 [Bacteroides fragilis str. 3998T(B)3]|uniref:Uncharacterized protein n=1 Tax=Bacteroides fragilis str. 3998T(B)3 TaxID=1339316 RepID=A0A015X5G2_BACFG|nr:hypothetical protein M125_5578 [Bacteroides fragilis str. 3998T(B)3]